MVSADKRMLLTLVKGVFMINELTDNDFHQEVEKSEIPYVVDFWAIWCAPCSLIAQALEELAKDYDGKIKVGKVNVDNEIKTANEFTIQNIPTIIIFKNGKEVDRIIGAVPKTHIVKKLKEYL